jgi:hypothetical protein
VVSAQAHPSELSHIQRSLYMPLKRRKREKRKRGEEA